MIDNNDTEIDAIKRKFAIIYAGSIALLIILFVVLARTGVIGSNTQEAAPGAELVRVQQLLVQDGMLHSRLNKLQQLDATFTMMIADSSKKLMVDSINRTILDAEASFLKLIDSFDYSNRKIALNTQGVTRDVTASFRDELSNRRTMANLRMALSMGNQVFTGDQQVMLQWQNELLNKQKRIESLENDLKSWQLNAYNNNTGGAISDLLKQDNETLQAAYKEQDKKIITLNATVASLKSENDRLKSAVPEPRKNDPADNNLKEKNTAMEKQINELTAELKFTQVDCNLSRADAGQIISTSKQRKVLLTDALAVLNGLGKTDDAVMQLRVKEKVAKLKQLAGTIRD